MGNCIVEVWSRVTGFMRPVQDWNKGKKAEFKDRHKYDKSLHNDDRNDPYPPTEYDGFKT